MPASDLFRRSTELEASVVDADDLVGAIESSDLEGVVEDPGDLFIGEVTEG